MSHKYIKVNCKIDQAPSINFVCSFFSILLKFFLLPEAGLTHQNSITDKISLLVTLSFILRYFCRNEYGMYPLTYLNVFSSAAGNLKSSEDILFTVDIV